MGLFDGKVAIVTGAGNGLGRAHALALAAEGARVVVNDYGGDTHGRPGTSAAAEAVCDEIRVAGGEAAADGHDVAGEGKDVVATALDAFGTVDLVVNNAGISGGGPLATIDLDFFDRMLRVHLGGTIAVSQAAWPHLQANAGRIVNTSSASVFGMPGSIAYVTAKAAVFGFTRALSHEGKANGVAVNAIMPTAYSRMTAQSPELSGPLEEHFPAEDVSPFVLALLSKDVPCTGETFVVGGGRAARVMLATVAGATGIDSPAAALEQFDAVMDMDGFVVPTDAIEEFRMQLRIVRGSRR